MSNSDFVNSSEEEGSESEKDIYLPGQKIEKDEELTYDPKAYRTFHQFEIGCSCLSFDIIPNFLPADSEATNNFTLISGTQSPSNTNKIIISQISCNSENGSNESSDSSDEESSKASISTIGFKHNGIVNRIKRSHINGREVAASFSDAGLVCIWDVTSEVSKLNIGMGITKKLKTGNQSKFPLWSYSQSNSEGYALSWSNVLPGRLATGNNDGVIRVFDPSGNTDWALDGSFNISSGNSVEDLQWSPNEKDILSSCGTDGYLRIWDCRMNSQKPSVAGVKVSDCDVNVISWSKYDPLIISGDDAGVIKVWDIRQISTSSECSAFYKHHTKAITSIEFDPNDSSVFASSGEDDQVTIWDLSAQRVEDGSPDLKGIPQELLFIHMGQSEIKEIHWHPQIKGMIVSSDISGFNAFISISV